MPTHCRKTASALLTAIAVSATSQAGITLDGKLGPSGPLTGPNYDITASLGTTKNNNLFHSFSQFNLAQNEIATFSGPANIQNILSRITGGSPSTIDGTIRSTISGANLFFINPKGVLFSSHAQIDVSGSFVVTTADYIKLANGSRFVATNPTSGDDALLSADAPIAFGFLGSNPGSISVAGSSLSVPNGKSFSMIGGDITVDGGTISAPGGRINMVSIQSPGELALDVTDFTAMPDTSAFATLGQINVQNGSIVDASGDGGGQVVVRGGKLVVDNAVVEANTLGSSDGKGIDIDVTGDLVVNGGAISASTSGSGKGGTINVTAGGTITLDGQGTTSGILSDVETTGTGNGGDITVAANTVDIQGGARISAATGGTGNGGDINLTANTITLDGNGMGFPLTGIAVSSETFSSSGGDAGHITIGPRGSGGLSLQVLNGALISARTLGGGDGGSIAVTASDILLDADTTGTLPFIVETGIAAETLGSGAGGSIHVQTGSLRLVHGSDLTASTEGTGAGGNIVINADSVAVQSSSKISAETAGLSDGGSIHIEANTVSLDGQRSDGTPGFAGIAAGDFFGFGSGFHGGDIALLANQVDVLNGAEISSSVIGGTIGGSVAIGPLLSGRLTLQVANRGQITTSTGGSGHAGDITINADSITVQSSAKISAETSGLSDGGSIHIEANTVSLDGQKPDGTPGHAYITAGDFSGSGSGFHGGDITILANQVDVLNGAEISSSVIGGTAGGTVTIGPLLSGKLALELANQGEITTSTGGSGRAGDISINADGLTILNGAQIASSSSSSVDGSGDGGTVNINAGSVLLQGGAKITVSTMAPATLAGDITIHSLSDIQLVGGSEISAQAGPVDDPSNDGQNGGNITLTAGKLIYLLDSKLTAQAVNNGGNITIDPQFVVLNNGRITADAIFGTGGQLSITSVFLFLSPGPLNQMITADSRFGTAGEVGIQAHIKDLSGTLLPLSVSLLGAEQQLPPYCGVRLGGISTFLVLGRGGLPLEPVGWQPSFAMDNAGGNQ